MRRWFALAALVLVSLGLITWVDRATYASLARFAPSLTFLAPSRIPSLLTCAGLHVAAAKDRAWRGPRSDTAWRRVGIVGLSWLAVTAYFVLVRRVWVPDIRGTTDVIAFMGTGLFAEELLFRGAVFEAAARAAAGNKTLPIAVSAVAFGLSHFQYHHFELTEPAVAQVLETILMGGFFGYLRATTDSIWPATGLHVANNAFTLLRSYSIL
jgi:membrane protease YdiL (CAAX protease family)